MSVYSEAFLNSFKHVDPEILENGPEYSNGELNGEYLKGARLVLNNETWKKEFSFRIMENAELLRSGDEKVRDKAIGALNELEFFSARFEYLESLLKGMEEDAKAKEEEEQAELNGLKTYESLPI